MRNDCKYGGSHTYIRIVYIDKLNIAQSVCLPDVFLSYFTAFPWLGDSLDIFCSWISQYDYTCNQRSGQFFWKVSINQSNNQANFYSANMFNHYQSAYKQFHSTETALLKIHNEILSSMDNGKVTALTLLDLSAAFDTIPLSSLISGHSILHHLYADDSQL